MTAADDGGRLSSLLDVPVTVLCVGDSDSLEALAASLRDSFSVDTATSVDEATGRLDDVDCVVSDLDFVATGEDGVVGDDMPRRAGLELLAAVRERQPTLPLVLCTARSLETLLDGLEDPWTDAVRRDTPEVTAPVLADRVDRLVTHRRTAALARRATAALEDAREGVAVVGPDGAFSLVNPSFARRVGSDPSTLRGRDWRTVFSHGTVDRLESTALERVRDDWRWTGNCVCERSDGTTFTARTDLNGLDDGGFVVSLSDADG